MCGLRGGVADVPKGAGSGNPFSGTTLRRNTAPRGIRIATPVCGLVRNDAQKIERLDFQICYAVPLYFGFLYSFLPTRNGQATFPTVQGFPFLFSSYCQRNDTQNVPTQPAKFRFRGRERGLPVPKRCSLQRGKIKPNRLPNPPRHCYEKQQALVAEVEEYQISTAQWPTLVNKGGWREATGGMRADWNAFYR